MNPNEREKFLYDFCNEVWEFLQSKDGKALLEASGGIMSAVEPNTKVVVHFSETNAVWRDKFLNRFLRETVVLREIEELQREFNDIAMEEFFEHAGA